MSRMWTCAACVQPLAGDADRLAFALEATGPEAVANIKAEIATAAEMTRQLGLSKEIRDDATEMARRAEYALGKAIRKGQAEGTVRSRRNTGGGPAAPYVRDGRTVMAGTSSRAGDVDMPSPNDFAAKVELHGNGCGGVGIYGLADNATEAEFETALTEAREEGNLSRANLVRKVKGQQGGESRQQRADKIAGLARQGHTSRQMVKQVGISDIAIRQIARDFGIDIPADLGEKQWLALTDWPRVLRAAASDLARYPAGRGPSASKESSR